MHTIKIEIPSDGKCNKCIFFSVSSAREINCIRFKRALWQRIGRNDSSNFTFQPRWREGHISGDLDYCTGEVYVNGKWQYFDSLIVDEEHLGGEIK